MKQLRKEHGESAVADLCVKIIERSGSDRVVVDGIRSLSEVDAFRKKAAVTLVAVHASQERRFALLQERGRNDDPISMEMFLRRDARELEVGIGNAIALADEVVSNEHSTPGKLAAQMAEIAERWVRTLGA